MWKMRLILQLKMINKHT